MSEKDQKAYETFKIALRDTIEKEKFKISALTPIVKSIGDPKLDAYFNKRNQFLSFCTGTETNIANINQYKGNEKYLDKIQKDFYLTIDSLRKEALKLMETSSKTWFTKLFESYFDNLKLLLKNILIYESQSDLFVIDKLLQEIELLKRKGK
ncbi:MAG: hypothetical protein U0457_20340 [Candidatus Sericytochromatia bacterium]